MYALIENNIVTEYPVTLKSLKSKNPNTSFPKSFDDFDYTQYGVVSVVDSGSPDINYDTHRLAGTAVENVDGVWTLTYQVEALTAEELARRTDAAAIGVRTLRNEKLAESDWRVTYEVEKAAVDGLGVQLPTVWSDYRQALRDITTQPGFPHNVTWPEEPST